MNIQYREKLYTESEEQYNLPVDMVYYIESEWDYKTNEYIQKHRTELESILNENPDRLLTYQLCYIPRNASSQQVQALFPMSKIHTESKPFSLFPHLARKCNYKKELEKKAWRIFINNSDFSLRLITHLLPNQYGDEEHLGFFAYDIEGVDVNDIPTIVRKYIEKVEEYNNEALTYGIDYRPKLEEKIQFEIEPMMPKMVNAMSEDEWDEDFDDGVQFSIVAPKVACLPVEASCHSLDAEVPQVSEQDRLRALAEKIKAEIDELQRQNGINILTEILSEEHKALIKQPVVISHMTIDSKFRIWLDDYNHLEIKIPTLCKAVYFLFLKHPEGIYLKDMWDYRYELKEIYMTISLRTNLDQMEQSIYDLVDPTSDSLQQKLSKISAAFRADLAADYAKLYTINGKRGEAYSIDLDPSDINLSQELKDLFARLQK